MPISRCVLVRGTNNADKMYGTNGDDSIFGQAGNDFLYGGGGNDCLSGGAGDDFLFGQAGNDSLVGDIGNDYLDGGVGNDLLNAGAGNDRVRLSAGVDYVHLGAGQDVLVGYGLGGGTAVLDFGPDDSITLFGVGQENVRISGNTLFADMNRDGVFETFIDGVGKELGSVAAAMASGDLTLNPNPPPGM